MSLPDEAHAESYAEVQDAARPGRIVAGRYELSSVLGRGGTSTVYRAIHTFTHRAVALKLLSPRHTHDRDLVARFLGEARAATALVHHNTVEVLDMGVDTDGEVYLAMELLDGDTLYEVIERERPIGPTRLAELILPIIDVLATAHRMGIVHRDIKPENVMVVRGPGGAERPVLLDFGIAKVLEVTRRTENGMILGTPSYMSPEQIGGEDDVGPPSDVWSMGVLMYEALSGELPFASGTLPSLFMSIAGNQRAPLCERMPAISEGWSSIVERALSTAPSDRFADATELGRAIRAELATPTALVARHPVGDTVAPPRRSTSPPSAPRPAWRWAVAAAIVVLSGVVMWSVTTLGGDAGSLGADAGSTSPAGLHDVDEGTEAAAALHAGPPTVPTEPGAVSAPTDLPPSDLPPSDLPPSGVRPSEVRPVRSADVPASERALRVRSPATAPPSADLPAAAAVEHATAPRRGLPEMATEW